MHLLLPSDKSFLLKRQEQLRSALNQYFNHEIQLHIKVQPLDKAQISPVLLKQQHQHQQQQQAEQTLAQDENLHALRTTLGAVLEKIIPPTE
jgi:D-hexose-6-phosphate mutarotase